MLAAKCNFGAYLDRALRDQFVVGLRSQEMVKRLLIEEDISTDVAVEVCKSMEAAQSKVESWSSHQSSGSHESHIRNISPIQSSEI
jgi:hypothetical protein